MRAQPIEVARPMFWIAAARTGKQGKRGPDYTAITEL
jgi:hypothetical protein